MQRSTTVLRILLALLLFALLVGSGLLYLVSLESARNWPELAHLRLPTYVAVLVGLVPVVVAVKRMFDLLAAVECGEASSTPTVQILRQLRLLTERSMTLTERSERVGITIANLSNLKTGKARAIRFTTLDAICTVLDCQPGDLLEPRPSGTPCHADHM